MCSPFMTEKFLTVNVNNVTKKEKDINNNKIFTSLNTPNINISMLISYKNVVVLERRHGSRSINTVQ